MQKKIERITVLAKDFTPAAMEFHKKNMSAKGYRKTFRGGNAPNQRRKRRTLNSRRTAFHAFE